MAASRESWEEVEQLPVDKLSLASAPTTPQASGSDAAGASESSERPSPAARNGTASTRLASPAPSTVHKPAASTSYVDTAVKDALASPKTRLTVIRFEADIEDFVKDADQRVMTFSDNLTSYQRLLAHRVAQHYGLETTTVDAGQEQVKVRAIKGPNTRLPQVKLATLASSNQQRWPASGEGAQANGEGKAHQASGAGVKLLTSTKANYRIPSANGAINPTTQRAPDRTFKERQHDYDKARSRLFANGPMDSNSSVTSSISGSRGRGTPVPKASPSSSPSPSARDAGSSMTASSLPVNRRQADGAGDQKAVFRNRDEEMRDPDFQRDANRYQPNFAPGFPDAANQSGMYIQRTYNSEFPTLAGGPGPIKGPMPPPGVPTVPTISTGHSLGMSFPGMPLLGPQMVPMAPDGTILGHNTMQGYAAHMPVPYAVFPGMNPGGMHIPHMQGMLVPGQVQYGMPFHPGAYGMSHPRPGGMDGLTMSPMQSLGMMPQTAMPMYGGYHPHQAGGMPMSGPRPSVGPMDRGGRGWGRGGGRSFSQVSPVHSGATSSAQRQGSTGSTASSRQPNSSASAAAHSPTPNPPAPPPPRPPASSPPSKSSEA